MIKKHLQDKGFTDSEISFLINEYKKTGDIVFSGSEGFLHVISFLLKKKYRPKEIRRIVSKNRDVFFMTENNYSKRILDLVNLGYNLGRIRRMVLDSSKILTIPLSHIESVQAFLRLYGLSRENMILSTSHNARLFDFSIEELRDELARLEEFGFTREQVIRLLSRKASSIFIPDKQLINRRNLLIELGFTLEEAFHILSYGTPITISEEKLVSTVKICLEEMPRETFLNNIDVAFVPSSELIAARMSFLKNRNIKLCGNVIEYIFSDEEKFKNRYLVSNREVLVIYKSRLELEEKRKRLELGEQNG